MWRLAKEVCKYVIAYHHGDGKKKPEESLKYVLHDEISLGAQHEQSEVCPTKLHMCMCVFGGRDSDTNV